MRIVENAVAARLALGGLKQAVDGFEEAVGLARLSPGNNAVEMGADHLRHLFHWFDLRAHHAGGPLREHIAHDIDLLALQNLAQLLLVEPGTGRAFGGHLRDERIQVGTSIRRQASAIPQEFPTQALQARIGLLFDAPGLVDGGAGVGDDVELVEGNPGVGQVLGHALDEGGRHVDGNGFDGLRIATVGGEVGGEGLDRVGVAPFGDEQHPTQIGIGDQRDVVMSARLRCLIGCQARNLGEVGLLQPQFNVTLADRHDLMPRQAHQPRHRREGHFPAHRHDQRLEEQRKAGKPSGPVGFDLPNTAIGQAHTRDANLQVALMLEEVQVPVALGHGVVRRMRPFDVGHSKTAAGDEVDGNGQGLLRHVELDPVDVPRGSNAQGGFEQLDGHVAVTHVSQGRASYLLTRLGNRRACLHGWMHHPAASSHGPAYRPIPGVKGALRRAAMTPQPALDPRPRATNVTHNYPLEIQKRQLKEKRHGNQE